MANADPLPGVFRVQQVVASSLAASLLVYAVLVEAWPRLGLPRPSWPESSLATVRFIFVFVAFAVYFLIRWVQQRLLVKRPEDSREVLVAKLGQASLLSLALAELPALLGFLLFLGSGNSRDFYPLMVISLILLYVTFPRYNLWLIFAQPRSGGADRTGPEAGGRGE
jgi:fucose 4-O-acetylase-like acetyltransferase